MTDETFAWRVVLVFVSVRVRIPAQMRGVASYRFCAIDFRNHPVITNILAPV